MTPLRGLWDWTFGRAHLLLTITALSWAGNAIASRLAVGAISPMLLTSLRWLFACLVLCAVVGREIMAHADVLRRRWLYVLAMGAAGFAGFNALSYSAAHHTTAVNISIIQGAIPALILLGAVLCYGERVRAVQVVGFVVALAGVCLIATAGDVAVLEHLAFNVGDLWMLFASVLYAGYAVALRERPKVPSLVLFAACSAAATVTSLPFAAYEAATGTLEWPTAAGWAIVAFTVLFPSIISQVFFMRGIELIGPGRAGIFVNLVPVFGAIMAVVILGEPFAPYHAAALALVLGGIWLAERKAGPVAKG